MSFVNYKGYTRELALSSVGPGWASLIHHIFDTLENIKGTVKIVQVKEKFAGLRVYTDYMNDELEAVIRQAERESFTICEECGKPGKVRGRSWYYTSCDEHARNNDQPHKYQPGDSYVQEEEAE